MNIKRSTKLYKAKLAGACLGVAVIAVVGVHFSSSSVHAVSGQLLNQWKFDETVAGSVAVDPVGSNDALPTNDPQPSTIVAPVTFTNPRSASFDGTNYFTIDRPAATDFTICAWVKTTSTGGGVDHWTSAPIMDSETGGVDYDFGFGVGNGGRLMFGNGGDDVNGGGLFDAQVNGTTPINDDAWHNVCVTRNNTTGLVNLYVDAQLDGSGVTGVGPLTSNPNARIGYGYDGAALFSGYIDDVRVYDTDLTPQQLEVLAEGGNDPINVAVNFDEQGGSSVGDITAAPGDVIVLPAGPTLAGYTFVGWNTAANGTGSSFAAGASYTAPTGNVTLYAIYEGVSVTSVAPVGVPNTGIPSSSLLPISVLFVSGLLLGGYGVVRLSRELKRRAQ